ncbi:MAG: riboflavin synthase subunit alpha [Bacteroidetes bacterium GWE2_29_8]|nr:MAG: riboflavin synthase subunit alpha [Bacteroidetes bacterium GWE2_29_8]OFY21711.1 MAG: riboflavin synthase subunit alpha [Bacteroidetes bacterium GWF2_29_10]
MFTGIVESLGKVVSIKKDKSNINFTIETPLAKELKVDQSLCHDGVCLTVVEVNTEAEQYIVTAIQETLIKSNMRCLVNGSEINLERSLSVNARFDGHIVQGHVDQTAICKSIEETDGSWKYVFEYDPKMGNYTVEKGSISVNGVSLTVVDSNENTFSVAIIPYTYNNTNFKDFKIGTIVNIEFDVVGKYIAKLFKLYQN